MAFRKLGDLIRGSDSKQLNVQEVLITLKLAGRRLVKQRKKLEHKEKQSLNRLKEMAQSGERLRAKQYAQRVAEIRSMIRHIESSEMTIERIKFKLESIETTQMLGNEMSNISKILKDINQSTKVPEITNNIMNIEMELGKLEGVGEEIEASMQPIENTDISAEANKLVDQYFGPSPTETVSDEEDKKIRSLRDKLARLEDREKA